LRLAQFVDSFAHKLAIFAELFDRIQARSRNDNQSTDRFVLFVNFLPEPA
jgi:hypothetical protein